MNKIALIAGVVSIVVIAGGYVLLKKTGTVPGRVAFDQQVVQKKDVPQVPVVKFPEPPPPPPEAVEKAKSFNDQLRRQMMKRMEELREQREAADKAGNNAAPPARKP